jgi:hypothetical protein
MGKTTTVRVVVPRGGHLMKPNRGTATAQPTRPTGRRKNVGGAARGSPPPWRPPLFFTLTAPPFPEAFTALWDAKVHPYVGAVKIVALHIVD